jgi:N4-gp56 family major capsid protein
MAARSYATGDAEVQKLWSKRVAREALKRTVCYQFFGESRDSLACIEPETEKSKGDQITVPLRMQLTGAGKTEGETLEGNEEAISSFTDSIKINELRHAVRQVKGITDQRIPWSIGTEMNDALADWAADRIDYIFFAHLGGYTPEIRATYTGFNTIQAPSTGRQLWTEAGTSDDQSLDSTGDEFTLAMIDKAREIATTGGSAALVPIRPIRGLGRNVDYVCFIHPTQTTQLRTTSGSQWKEITLGLLQGGQSEETSKFMTGALGIYNRTMLVESVRVPLGVNSSTGASISTVRRALFCGAQALTCAFGAGFGPEQWKTRDEIFDYGHEAGQSLENIFGIKKTRFNSSDFATIVISSYAANAA